MMVNGNMTISINQPLRYQSMMPLISFMVISWSGSTVRGDHGVFVRLGVEKKPMAEGKELS